MSSPNSYAEVSSTTYNVAQLGNLVQNLMKCVKVVGYILQNKNHPTHWTRRRSHELVLELYWISVTWNLDTLLHKDLLIYLIQLLATRYF